MTWTPSTPSLPPGSGRPTPTSARSTGSSPPPTPESSSATYTQTLRGDGILGSSSVATPARHSIGVHVGPRLSGDNELDDGGPLARAAEMDADGLQVSLADPQGWPQPLP